MSSSDALGLELMRDVFAPHWRLGQIGAAAVLLDRLKLPFSSFTDTLAEMRHTDPQVGPMDVFERMLERHAQQPQVAQFLNS